MEECSFSWFDAVPGVFCGTLGKEIVVAFDCPSELAVAVGLCRGRIVDFGFLSAGAFCSSWDFLLKRETGVFWVLVDD